jgi:hypothetical protein
MIHEKTSHFSPPYVVSVGPKARFKLVEQATVQYKKLAVRWRRIKSGKFFFTLRQLSKKGYLIRAYLDVSFSLLLDWFFRLMLRYLQNKNRSEGATARVSLVVR